MTDSLKALQDIGVIGLGVMGQNLSLNIARNGYKVVVFDRDPPVVELFLGGVEVDGVTAARTAKDFALALKQPRKIIVLVKAGDPVDWTIDQVKAFLEPGDIIVDGGNSHFSDTERRQQLLKDDGLFFIGSGISGGEKGALLGPALMPGGDKVAYEQIQPIWEAIAAQTDDGRCVSYIGPGGAGHFVKMVHNGIEYADMQIIAEVYGVMRDGFQMTAGQIADVFDQWRGTELDSYLIDITSTILRVKDAETQQPLVDLVLDQAEQKGTGKWTSQVALDLGVPIPTIDAAIAARTISAQKVERVNASKQITGRTTGRASGINDAFLNALREALYASKICAYSQGMALIKAGSEAFNWKIDLSEIARIWQGGCIIRSALLKTIRKAYLRRPDLQNLLVDAEVNLLMEKAQSSWRIITSLTLQQGLPALAMTASLGYFDMYRSATLPLNLTQAQRDLFGSHLYRRVDKPEIGLVHTNWDD
jgi:6-phosphogluconate dehydrogenase